MLLYSVAIVWYLKGSNLLASPLLIQPYEANIWTTAIGDIRLGFMLLSDLPVRWYGVYELSPPYTTEDGGVG